MAPPSSSHEAECEKFSLPLFAFTVSVTLACLVAALWLVVPGVWRAQFLVTPGKAVAAFAAISLLNCFIEYFFHRYVLHVAPVPILSRLYRQHTLHHALTRIVRKQASNGRGIYFIESKFPIIEPEQGEASFFPWYTMAVFACALTPVLVLLQWVFPSFPWFFSGWAALTTSLALYEIFHAINHWDFAKWEPLIVHPTWGRLWRPIYAFHLRHHAVIDCNESISGFFGLPLGDWVFGTCLMPATIYTDGEEWAPEKFSSPRPRWIVRRLDAWAAGVVARRRVHAREEAAEVAAGAAAAESAAEETAGGLNQATGSGPSATA